MGLSNKQTKGDASMTEQQQQADKKAAEDRKAAEDKRLADDKKKLAEEREAREKAQAEREKHRGTPTPTQEEADLAKLGHHVDLAKDGSPEEGAVQERQAVAGGHANYETRQMGSLKEQHPAGTTHQPPPPPPPPPPKPKTP
jgi:hypothetical protein